MSSIDDLLESGQWRSWRQRHLGDTAILDNASRAWCSAPYWDHHTPALEDWKDVVESLAGRGLHDAVAFPAIPLFEDEQVRDLCRLVTNADELALLADAIDAKEDLLTVNPREAGLRCWAAATPEVRGNLANGAWQWMRQGRPAGLPSPEDAATLLPASTPLRSSAVKRLKSAAIECFETSQWVREALALADTFAFWGDPAFASAVRELYARNGGPELLAPRLAAATVAEYAASAPVAPAAPRPRELAASLFDGTADAAAWSSLDLETLAAIAREMASAEAPAEYEERAWESLRGILERHPRLLAPRQGRIAAFDLAAAVRSKTTAGAVAADLIRLAGGHRSNPSWWRALLASLAPAPRRGNLCNAGDRTDRARLAVKLQKRWLTTEEAGAMEAAFAGFGAETLHERK